MSRLAIRILAIAIAILIYSCSRDDEIEKCDIDIDSFDFTFGIDYDNPASYLVPGEQSDLKTAYLEEIRTAIGTPTNDIDGVRSVCTWVNQNFQWENAGGSMIAKKTADELFESKSFYGCHSAALIISSILLEFGFPAVMIETASVQWGYDYADGSTRDFVGHVMSEIFVKDKWILLDNNGAHVSDYDHLNAFIPTSNTQVKSLFTLAKGTDIWDYGVRDESDTHSMMREFSDNIICFESLFNTINYRWSN